MRDCKAWPALLPQIAKSTAVNQEKKGRHKQMAVNKALRGDVVKFIRKSTEGETRFKLQGEARTSLFVFICLD